MLSITADDVECESTEYTDNTSKVALHGNGCFCCKCDHLWEKGPFVAKSAIEMYTIIGKEVNSLVSVSKHTMIP